MAQSAASPDDRRNKSSLVSSGFAWLQLVRLPNAFTAVADVMMGYSLHLMRQLTLLDDQLEHACGYLARLAEREAFQRALST